MKNEKALAISGTLVVATLLASLPAAAEPTGSQTSLLVFEARSLFPLPWSLWLLLVVLVVLPAVALAWVVHSLEDEVGFAAPKAAARRADGTWRVSLVDGFYRLRAEWTAAWLAIAMIVLVSRDTPRLHRLGALPR